MIILLERKEIMDRNSEPIENKYLQVRKVALIKKHTKRIAIVAICASLFSFAFAAGYIGTFLLLK